MNENEKEKKVTKKDYFKVLRELAEAAGNQEAVEFCDKEVARLEKAKKGKTKAQKENEVLAETVYEVLEGLATPVTATQLLKADERFADFSVQKLSALLKILVNAKRVVKVTEKKKSYFSVAEEVE